MVTIKIIGIIAIIVFLVSFLGNKAMDWFLTPGRIPDKVFEILEYVSSGSIVIAAACGIISLFA